MQQALQASPLQLALALLETVFGQDDGRRIDDDHTRIAIDDDPIVLSHQLAGGARADHGRDVHAARHDSGVRGLATYIGDKTRKHALLELQHVGRRQVVRDQNQRHIHRVIQQQILRALARPALRIGVRSQRRQCALHGTQHALSNLLHVSLALAQVLVFHFVEMAGHNFQLRGQRPLGVVQAFGDPALHAPNQFHVLQQHQVHIQQGIQLMGCLFGPHVRDAGLQAADLFNHRVAPLAHALYFGLDLIGIDEIVRHVHAAGGHQHRPPDGNAPGDGEAVDGESQSTLLARSQDGRTLCSLSSVGSALRAPPFTCAERPAGLAPRAT